jgi:hypothetical protein
MVQFAQGLHGVSNSSSDVDVFPMYRAMKDLLLLLAISQYCEIARTPSSRVYASRD